MSATTRVFTVLLYSDDPQVRHEFRVAIGEQPAPDLTLRFVEAGSAAEVVSLVDGGGIALLVADGEAWPAGGLGIARQLRDEVAETPLLCVAIARAADRWLAAWAQVDGLLMLPVDPVAATATATRLLRERYNLVAATVPAVPVPDTARRR